MQTGSDLGAVWSGSELFAQAYVSKNLGSLRYVIFRTWSCFANWVINIIVIMCSKTYERW